MESRRVIQKDSMEQIYVQYQERVYNSIYYKIGHKECAEDLTSLVFVKIMRNIHTYDKEKGSLTTWINRIVQNTLIDYYRRKRSEPVSLFDNAMHENLISDLEDIEYFSDISFLIKDAISKLNSQEQHLISLKYYKELTNREIARRCGINESTVSTRFYRVLRKMRNHICKSVS